MPTNTWKAAERRVAAMVGGQRVGNRGSTTEDVEHALLSIECKHTSKAPKLIVDGLQQARRNAPAGKTPVVVLHPAGSRQYLAILDLSALMALIGGKCD